MTTAAIIISPNELMTTMSKGGVPSNAVAHTTYDGRIIFTFPSSDVDTQELVEANKALVEVNAKGGAEYAKLKKLYDEAKGNEVKMIEEVFNKQSEAKMLTKQLADSDAQVTKLLRAATKRPVVDTTKVKAMGKRIKVLEDGHSKVLAQHVVEVAKLKGEVKEGLDIIDGLNKQVVEVTKDGIAPDVKQGLIDKGYNSAMARCKELHADVAKAESIDTRVVKVDTKVIESKVKKVMVKEGLAQVGVRFGSTGSGASEPVEEVSNPFGGTGSIGSLAEQMAKSKILG